MCGKIDVSGGRRFSWHERICYAHCKLRDNLNVIRIVLPAGK